jgi:hypothetical protein
MVIPRIPFTPCLVAALATSACATAPTPLAPPRLSYTLVEQGGGRRETLGDEWEVFSSQEAIRLTNETSGPPIYDLKGSCVMFRVVRRSSATIAVNGLCRYVDEDGDELFERMTFDDQPLDRTGVGQGRWLGGTGKYSNAKANFAIHQLLVAPQVKVGAITNGEKVMTGVTGCDVCRPGTPPRATAGATPLQR